MTFLCWRRSRDGLEAGAQRQGGLARAGAAAEGDDADLGVEQHLQGDPLLGGAAVDAEGLPVAAHQPHLLVGADPAQGGAAVRQQHQAAVAGQLAGGGQVERPVVVQLVELGGGHVELGHAGVARVGVADRVAAVVLGVQADRRCLDAQRQVLGHERDRMALVGEVAGHREDPGVVVAQPESRRQRRRVGVVELDPDGATVVADRHRLVEAAVRDPQIVEHPQRGPGEEAQLRMVPLALQLGDHHHGEHHLVLGEPPERAGVGEQHAGVEDERPMRTDGTRLLGLRHWNTPHDRRWHSRPGPRSSSQGRTGKVPVGRSAGPRAQGGELPLRGRDLPRTCLPVRRASPPADVSKVRRPASGSWQHARSRGEQCVSGRRWSGGARSWRAHPRSFRRRSGARAGCRRGWRAGSPPCGSPASRPRRSRTRSAPTATARTRRDAAPRRSG